MQILTEGRSAFLEFLRNLTPQALILAFALKLGEPLTATCCYSENITQTALFIILFCAWVAAVWENSSLFVEKCLFSAPSINEEAKRLKDSGLIGNKHFYALLKYAIKKKPTIFLETFVVFLFVEAALTFVVVLAIDTASKFIR